MVRPFSSLSWSCQHLFTRLYLRQRRISPSHRPFLKKQVEVYRTLAEHCQNSGTNSILLSLYSNCLATRGAKKTARNQTQSRRDIHLLLEDVAHARKASSTPLVSCASHLRWDLISIASVPGDAARRKLPSPLDLASDHIDPT